MTRSRVWLIARRPLFLALVFGCAVSLFASGRLTIRLVADGALSFAFVPLAELAGFAVVYRLSRTSLPFAEAVDRFFAGNTPWLWWMVAGMIAGVVLSPYRHGELGAPLLVTLLIPVVLSVMIDARFFCDVMGRSRGRARLDVAIQRIVSWSTGIAYFLGLAITRRDFLYLFVEIWNEIAAWVTKWT